MSTHPAVLASQNSAQHAMAGAKEAAIEKYSERWIQPTRG